MIPGTSRANPLPLSFAMPDDISPLPPEQTRNLPYSNAVYLSCWQQWLTTPPPADDELRKEAVEELKSCLFLHKPALVLSALGLTSLPPLLPPCQILYLGANRLTQLDTHFPPALTSLFVNNNRLAQLPENLPANLRALELQANPLRQIETPLPAGLERLDLFDCDLSTLPPLPNGLTRLLLGRNHRLMALPDRLPNALQVLDVQGCRLTTLPAYLPSGLQDLNVANNLLQSLPETLPDSLGWLDVSGNRLRRLPQRLPNQLRQLLARRNPALHLTDALPKSLVELNLGECRLESIPEDLPDSLQALYLGHNHIAGMPAHLPASLRALEVNNNFLTTLPENLPNKLTELYLPDNPLVVLPTRLPASLQRIDVANCRIDRLPETLPGRLQALNVTNNRLRTLPDALFQLPASCVIDLHFNPLSEATRSLLVDLNHASGYNGPNIAFYSSAEQEALQAYPLPVEVASWFPPSHAIVIKSQWQSTEQEPNAELFSRFLQRLGDTVNARYDPAFRARIAEWLARLAATPTLRAQTFLLLENAVTDCQDRVTFYFNQMVALAEVYDMDNGQYDRRLPELVQRARQLFRLEQLQSVAQQKVNTQHHADEIEVWLAYQVQLRQQLELTTVSKKMRFFKSALITPEDINQALSHVQARERELFASWLAQWPVWKNTIRRLDARRYADAERQREQLAEALYQPQAHKEVQARLQEAGVLADTDAERNAAKGVFDSAMENIDLTLTQKFLAARRLSALLDYPQPVLATDTSGPSTSLAEDAGSRS